MIVAMAFPSITAWRAVHTRSAGIKKGLSIRRSFPVEQDFDARVPEAGDLQRNRKVLADRIFCRSAGKPAEHRVDRLFERQFLGRPRVLAAQRVLRFAGNPDALAQILRASFVEVGLAGLERRQAHVSTCLSASQFSREASISDRSIV